MSSKYWPMFLSKKILLSMEYFFTCMVKRIIPHGKFSWSNIFRDVINAHNFL
jgi:hypothetical protein